MKGQPSIAGIRRDALVPPGAASLVRTAPQLWRASAALDRVRGGGLTVWYGIQGTGKTCAAWLLCQLAQERTGPRALYVDAPRPCGAVWDERKTIRALIGELGAPLSDRAVRGQSTNHLIRHLATRLLAADVRVLVVDEAGYLGPHGLEAIGMLIDYLTSQSEPFHVLLAGMMDLPELLRTSPRVCSRVVAFDHFAEVSVETLEAVVMQHHPWIREVLEEGAGLARLMLRAHELTQGCLREAIWLFEHVRSDCVVHGIRLNPAVVEHAARERSAARARLAREEVLQAAAREDLPELMAPELRRRFRNAGAWDQ